MRSRKGPLPAIWLMTDERGGDPVALGRALPPGSGIIFRHYATAPVQRRALFRQLRRVTRARRLMLVLAGTPTEALNWGADGAHHRSLYPSRGIRSMAAHDRRELTAAIRVSADLIFISPVFSTRSHAHARALGPARLGLLVGRERHRTIALGGMDAGNFKRVRALRIHGWAGIDAFGSDQKRNAVPT